MDFDLLKTVEYGGCSAKLPPGELAGILSKLPQMHHPNIMVDIETHDDAGVYKLNDETALIFTTDFFPPICSDPFEFGEIAATNALSDVYAMGGTPLLALNLVMFSTVEMPLSVFAKILEGGYNKVKEAGALIMGGHTIEDHPPKYGLAVVGTIHPEKLITNAAARPGDILVLTKPLGIGVMVAAKRLNMAREEAYRTALDQMKMLNNVGRDVMVRHGIKCATDVTGFGLLGHALKMAQASGVSLAIKSKALPIISQAEQLAYDGCIPGAAFRNLDFVQSSLHVAKSAEPHLKMLATDAQTSGGLLMCVPQEKAEAVLNELKASKGLSQAAIIGEVLPKTRKSIYLE
ncbi:selenide, water dikinase SelD [Thermophagus sp. OGC60D27]|uniref:selenide, water dikinase SelD n=1 Tax=Thermophagus sp. OGC60D27 TaxID=3458415 RepID=UPI0040376CA0